MKIFYSDHYALPLPDKHRFPKTKYQLIREALVDQQVFAKDCFFPACKVNIEFLYHAHTHEYCQAMASGTIDPKAMKPVGFPWSPALYERSLASMGGSLAATLAALEEGISGHLAGGTHHAFADRGEGFCIFNDLATISLFLLRQNRVQRIAIVDLDVHQGNGTAAILQEYPHIFTLSIHGERNYPFRKVASSLDIGLPDQAQDDDYMIALEEGMKQVWKFQPDMIFYQAGVDVLEEDSLGRLSLSMEGIARRDEYLLHQCFIRETPIVITLGGGYCKPIEKTVEAHVNTYKVVKRVYFS